MSRASLLLLAFLLSIAAALAAQVPYFRGRAFYGNVEQNVLPAERTGFTFCRLVYGSVRREPGGSGWTTDYPLADQNLMIRLSELTLTPITRQPGGYPAHALVRADSPAIFGCPFLFASDVGTAGFTAEEVAGLREYLLKGGFLWADDFWGERAMTHWLEQLGRIVPEFKPVELTMDAPIFSSFYFVEEVPQIPSIRHWRNTRGGTSERGAESAVPRVWGIHDDDDRLLVLMSHNTDIADGWEREGEDEAFFHLFSPRGYAVGVNVAIWSMTH